ncbi:hypothetical protein HPB52_020027 [Rhipicephalus sanguineus]|uniref:Secreted protein n=1 Tax=Rhipicephalus sanguineus TaxID=34632 RepID=A0A9D4QBX3_RHISA|nr:hypothetical protein HPB52_020027 [Rhipicephalus sanguineus]
MTARRLRALFLVRTATALVDGGGVLCSDELLIQVEMESLSDSERTSSDGSSTSDDDEPGVLDAAADIGHQEEPRLTLGFHDYVHGPHGGLFDLFEILGGLTVYMMMSSVPLACRASPFLRPCSFTCSLGGVHMIVSSMLSPVSAYYLPRIFCVSTFETLGACHLPSRQ